MDPAPRLILCDVGVHRMAKSNHGILVGAGLKHVVQRVCGGRVQVWQSQHIWKAQSVSRLV
eukprot:3970319-Pleurochrysis_carterae.AAC.1